MADISESTPLLASNDRPDDTNAHNDSEDEIPTLDLPANAHIKRPIKILTICVSIASVLGVIFLTASFVTVLAAPFAPFPPFPFPPFPPFLYTYGARYILQELGTCVSASNFSSRVRSKLVISKRVGHANSFRNSGFHLLHPIDLYDLPRDSYHGQPSHRSYPYHPGPRICWKYLWTRMA
jgi:hypothetical protein